MMKSPNIGYGLPLIIGFLFVTLSMSVARAQDKAAIRAALAEVSADSMFQTFNELSGTIPVTINGKVDTIRTRQFNQAGNEKAFIYLRERMRSMNIAVDSQVYSADGKNLFGILPGSTDTTHVIILGAHYDNAGYIQSQGADDNASGVAAALECLRVIRKLRLPYTVIAAFWDEEESDCIGSKAYVARFLSGTKEPAGSINLDMIGWDGNHDTMANIHVRDVGNSNAWADAAFSVNSEYGIGLRLQRIDPGYIATDQMSFWASGLPAIGITEDYFVDPNRNRHTTNDTVGSIDSAYVLRTTRLALGTLLNRSSVAVNVGTTASRTKMALYPNPASSQLTIVIEPPPSAANTLDVIDARGTLVERITATGSTLRLNTVAYANGIYFVKLYDDKQRFVRAQRFSITK